MTTPNQSFTFNAYQSNLAGPLLAGLTTVALDFIPSGLGVPAYLVIDPDVPASREYIKVLAYTGNTIDSMERNLEGSAGDVDHLVGAVIRAVYTMQALDDTFLDIEGNTTAQTAHINDSGDPHAAAGYAKTTELQTHIDNVGDPHAAAGYQKVTEADAAYLRLDGTNPMAAAIDMSNFPVNQLATPTLDDDAATKKYVDDQDGLFLPLGGGTMSGPIDMGGQLITDIGLSAADTSAAQVSQTTPDNAVVLSPVSPWAGSMTLIKQGGIVTAFVNVSRAPVTLNGFTLFTTIPTALQPGTTTVNFLLSNMTTTDPSAVVIDVAQCSIGIGSSNLVVDSRTVTVAAMRGNFSYRVTV